MNFVDEITQFLKKYINKINFGKAYLYKLQDINLSCEHDFKHLEKRFLMNDISLFNIVEGRLTISVPSNIIEKITEIMVISE